MCINKYGGKFRVDDLFSVNDRIAVGGKDFTPGTTGLPEDFPPVLGSFYHILLVLSYRTDGWYPDQSEQFLYKPIPVFVDVLPDIFHCL